MPNWCSNALSVSSNNNEEQLHIESLFNGNFTNRTDEITTKLRKILLAGIGSVLHPSKDIEPSVFDAAVKLHNGLATNIRGDDERSQPYSQFLNILVNGSITPSDYEALDSLYKRTGLDKLWWGDISKEKRNKIKTVWKHCSYDFSARYKSDISIWWTKASLYKNTSKADVLDMRVLTPLPVSVMVNGFNGKILNCGRTYDWYTDNLGTKWPAFEIYPHHNGNYIFSTAWSPVRPIIHLLPSFVANAMDKHEDDLEMSCDLYYFESGCAFQGINDDVTELNWTHDEETDEYEEEFLPEIAEAFGEY